MIDGHGGHLVIYVKRGSKAFISALTWTVLETSINPKELDAAKDMRTFLRRQLERDLSIPVEQIVFSAARTFKFKVSLRDIQNASGYVSDLVAKADNKTGTASNENNSWKALCVLSEARKLTQPTQNN